MTQEIMARLMIIWIENTHTNQNLFARNISTFLQYQTNIQGLRIERYLQRRKHWYMPLSTRLLNISDTTINELGFD